MSEALPKIDLFGTSVNFNLDGKPKAKSRHGALCSLLFLAFVGWAIYHTSKDIFGRKDPKTNFAEAFSEDPREMVLTEDNFVFAFGMQHNADQLLAHFIDETIYKADIYYLKRQYVEGQEDPQWEQIPLETEICTPEHFGQMNKSFTSLPLSNLYCVKKEQTALKELKIQGSVDSSTYAFLDVVISRCTEFNSGVPCADEALINSTLSGSYFIMYYSNMAVNPKESQHPDIRYRDSYITMLSSEYYKQSTLSLKHLTVTTDYGWLFEQSEVKDYAQFDLPWEQMDLRPSALGYLLDCVIQVDKLEKVYTRSYVKIQDILAEVDGLATSCMIIMIIVITPYSQIKVQESLINEMFDVKKPRKGHNNNNRKKKNKRNSIKNTIYKETNIDNNTLKDVENKVKSGELVKASTGHILIPSLESPKSVTGLLRKETQKLETHVTKFKKHVIEDTAKNSHNTSSVESDQGCESEVVSPKRLLDHSDKVKWIQKNFQTPTRRSETLKASRYEEKNPAPVFLELTKKHGHRDSASHHSQFSLHPEIAKTPSKFVPEAEDVEAPSFVSEILGQTEAEKDINSQVKSQAQQEELLLENGIKIHIEESPVGKFLKEECEIAACQDNKQEEGNLDLCSDGENEVASQDEIEEENKKLNFTFWDYIRSYVWKSSAVKDKIALLNAGKRNIEERLDIFNIMKKFREVDKLKALLLEDHQLVLFEGLPKPEITLDNNSSVDETSNAAHSILMKPKFIEETKRQDQIIKSYNILKSRQRKTKVDQKLLAIYDEIINPLVAMAFTMRNPVS